MSDHPDPPDLDLIERVQRARMAHDRDATPSTVGGLAPTSRAGVFILQTDVAAIDALWARVRQATEAGTLGYKSKVSTASRSPQGQDRVIHVMTYDADDTADVARVGAALKALGLTPTEYRRNNT